MLTREIILQTNKWEFILPFGSEEVDIFQLIDVLYADRNTIFLKINYETNKYEIAQDQNTKIVINGIIKSTADLIRLEKYLNIFDY